MMEFIVDIERILPGGVGLAHAEGKTIFVSLAAPGDRVRVAIDREQGNLLFASIKEILTPSPVRIEPPCPYFGRCGGCDFQQLTYEAQLAAKADMIRDCLQRIAKLDKIPAFAVQPSSSEWRYRSRATWQIDQEQQKIGYYERGSRRVCDVSECAVLVPGLQTALENVRATAFFEFPPTLQHLEATVGENGVSVAPEFAGFQTAELTAEVGGEHYSYNAESFFQVNHRVLADLIANALHDANGTEALDLYCGAGLFTLPLARRFQKVTAVENNPKAVKFLRRNLQRAGLTNVGIESATVTEWFRFKREQVGLLDLILLDPPRAGAESAVIRGILDLRPRRISYVSCDPATLSRDLKKLFPAYHLDSIAAFDMFPQTHHVETIAHLSALENTQ